MRFWDFLLDSWHYFERVMKEFERRKTFAIIAHPDAGKTTLTEKLLLYGGAIQMAGAVRARGEQRRSRSDWMKIEKERGISVSASVMSFEFENYCFNLLDTPGHEDFSEDTYRTLTAVDSAVMVIDAAKGIEAQTRKLFEVCRLRNIPIITFINKMDREAKDPFELLDEIEQTLALDVSPINFPIGMGKSFKGCYSLNQSEILLMDEEEKNKKGTVTKIENFEDPKLKAILDDEMRKDLQEQVQMATELCPTFDPEAFWEGHMTPVFFGSAIKSFGVLELLKGLKEYAPIPRSQSTTSREIKPDEKITSGFVFKVQANMDPKHRDRIAFFRLCSGHFKRGHKLKNLRSDKQLAVNNAVLFLANDRDLAEDAYPGDIIGIPNHGTLRIGDTLTDGEALPFTGVPHFAPELFQRVHLNDPLKVKHLRKALEHFAEEGASQLFKPLLGADWIVGVVGSLQFEVLSDRLKAEYQINANFEAASFYTARWVIGDDKKLIDKFMQEYRANLAEDHDGDMVFLPRNSWQLDKAVEDYQALKFEKIKEFKL